MEKLREQYKNEVIPALMKKFNYKSVMEVPKLEKIVVNMGVGDATVNSKNLENAVKEFINNTYSVNEFKLEYRLSKTNLSNYLERSELIKYVASLAQNEIKDKVERENFIIMASKKIGCNKELISENVDNLKRKVVKSLRVVETKNNNNRYYIAEMEIIKEMLFSKDATYYYITNLGYMLDNIHRSIATYVVDYYYKRFSAL